jgi:energy-coupling factor transporter ATP-binding protein EcfA2
MSEPQAYGRPSGALLSVRDLHTHFPVRTGVVKAVDGVSFDVEFGQTLCVVGESGSGKSVTARSILQIVDAPGRIVSGSMVLNLPGRAPVDLAKLDARSREIRAIRGSTIRSSARGPAGARTSPNSTPHSRRGSRTGRVRRSRRPPRPRASRSGPSSRRPSCCRP